MDNPFFHRWVYDPNQGVMISHNLDSHPAFVKYHEELGPDLTGGFAYKIGNGWRITDRESKPLDDPYIVNQVVRRLNYRDEPETRLEGSWKPINWDRLHYALPCD